MFKPDFRKLKLKLVCMLNFFPDIPLGHFKENKALPLAE